MKYSHNCGSKYVSVMVPLNTGQSKQIMLKICDKTICCYCQTNACVNMLDGTRVYVGECADCALSTGFANSFGCIIPPNTTLDEFLKNESKYIILPSVWLKAYLDDSLTHYLLNRTHGEAELAKAMEMMLDFQDCLTTNTYEDCLTIDADLSSLQIASPKLVGRVRRHMDMDIADNMDELCLIDDVEPRRKMQRRCV